MESFLKEVLAGKSSPQAHRYFVRFGKGTYARRFLLRFSRGKMIKVKASFEMANDLVMFAHSIGALVFSGKILSKHQLAGMNGRKKAGTFSYDVQEASLKEYAGAYSYLLDATAPGIILKIKKSLPKPGKNEEKIDDAFCSLDIDPVHWPQLKAAFFWDIPECKSAHISHTLKITDIVFPQGEKDPVKVRELALRKGVITRVITIDEKETARDHPLEA